MCVRLFAGFVGVAAVTMGAFLHAVVPAASAQSCPEVEVVFARGTGEPPGVGPLISGPPASKALEVRGLMWCRRPDAVQRPRWCWAATRKERL